MEGPFKQCKCAQEGSLLRVGLSRILAPKFDLDD